MKTKLTTKDRVEIAIRCALDIGDSPDFETWGHKHLNGASSTIPETYEIAMLSHSYTAHNAAISAHYAVRAHTSSTTEKLPGRTLSMLATNRAAESIIWAHKRGADTAGIIRTVLRGK